MTARQRSTFDFNHPGASATLPGKEKNMKLRTQRALSIFTGAAAHQFAALQQRIFAAQRYLTAAQTATLCAEMCRARGLTVLYPAGETTPSARS